MTLKQILKLLCTECGTEYDIDEDIETCYKCRKCKHRLMGCCECED